MFVFEFMRKGKLMTTNIRFDHFIAPLSKSLEILGYNVIILIRK